MITVILIDKNPIFRLGLKKFLADENIEIIGEAANGIGGIELVSKKKPDIVLLEVYLPDTPGILVSHDISRHSKKTKSLFLLDTDHLPTISRLLETPAKGFLMKNSRYSGVEAIKSVHEGSTYMQPDLAIKLLEYHAKGGLQSDSRLTSKEYLVLVMIALGKSYDIIAAQLHVTRKTVFNIKSHGFKKLEIQNLGQLREIILGPFISGC